MYTDFKRLFIALPVDDEKQIKNIEHTYDNLKKYDSFLKIVPKQNFHITVKFLGSVKSDIAESLRTSFLTLNHLKKIEYRIENIGAFPSHNNPSVIWAGLKCEDKSLYEIIHAVESLTSTFGFTVEKRKFVPHLTLARVKKECNVSSEFKEYLKDELSLPIIKTFFRELVLFESILKNTGPEYRKIEVINLI